jgi:putative addiction module component (TIGR02574 family)
MADFDALLSDASRLPVDQRIEFLEALWNTVPQSALPPLNEEWAAEIARRSSEYDAGLVQPIPWEQVRSEALRRVGIAE